MTTSLPWPEAFFSHPHSILYYRDPWNSYVYTQLIFQCLPMSCVNSPLFFFFFGSGCAQWKHGASLGRGAENMLSCIHVGQCLRPWSREKIRGVRLNLPSLSLLALWEGHHRKTLSQLCEIWGQKAVLNLAMICFTEWGNENLGVDTMWIIQKREMSKKRCGIWSRELQCQIQDFRTVQVILL